MHAVTFTYSCNVSLQLNLNYLHVVYDILIIFLFYPCSLYHQTIKAKIGTLCVHVSAKRSVKEVKAI